MTGRVLMWANLAVTAATWYVAALVMGVLMHWPWAVRQGAWVMEVLR